MNPMLTRTRTAFCLALLLQLAGCASTHNTPAGSVAARLNNADDAYIVLGQKSPTVVLQAGFGDGKNVWVDVAEDLSRNYTVFAYDRPGHGGNPASETPRDPCTIAAELRDQLRSAGLKPPYVLVGHSLGGLYQYVFDRLYPNEVAGLVLLDPTHPRHLENMEREVPALASLVKGMSKVTFGRTDRREFEAQAICLDKVESTPPISAPTRLLVSGRFKEVEKGDFEKMVKRLRQDWQRLTKAPKVEVIHDSGHYLQKESPEAVVAAVRAVLGNDKAGGQ